MEVRKRTRQGKSLKQKISEPLRVMAKDKINKTYTLSFSLEAHDTEFNLTLTENELLNLYIDLDIKGESDA